MVNLQILNLDNNRITEIKGLDNKYNLQELDLSSNMITEIQNIDKLLKLQHLYLHNNMITKILLTILNNTNLSYYMMTKIPLEY